MITLTIILITLLSLIIATMLVILAGGAGFVLAMSDLIVCAGIIYLIVWLFKRK
jgi:hypothetical protein